MKLIPTTIFTLLSSLVMAQHFSHDPLKSFDNHKSLVNEVELYRKERLIDLKTFLRLSREKDVVI
jgi:hypothetical protein